MKPSSFVRRGSVAALVAACVACVACAASAPAPVPPPKDPVAEVGGRRLPSESFGVLADGAEPPAGSFVSANFHLGFSYAPLFVQVVEVDDGARLIAFVTRDGCARGYPPTTALAGRLWLPAPARPVEFRTIAVSCAPVDPRSPPIP